MHNLQIGRQTVGSHHPTLLVATLVASDWDAAASAAVQRAAALGLGAVALAADQLAAIEVGALPANLARIARVQDPSDVEAARAHGAEALLLPADRALDHDFVRMVAGSRRPVFFQTDGLGFEGVLRAAATLAEHGAERVPIHDPHLHGGDEAGANLGVIARLRRSFPGPLGFRERGADGEPAALSVMAGARVVMIPLETVASGSEQLEKTIERLREVEGMVGTGRIAVRSEVTGPIETAFRAPSGW